MRIFLLMASLAGLLLGCVHPDQGGVGNEDGSLSVTNQDATFPFDRGGRPGGTGPGGSTVGGTGSAPVR